MISREAYPKVHRELCSLTFDSYDLELKPIRSNEIPPEVITEEVLTELNPSEYSFEVYLMYRLLFIPKDITESKIEEAYIFIFPTYIGAAIPFFKDKAAYTTLDRKLRELANKYNVRLYTKLLK